jgi:cytochrome c oxidase assembly protein subunit 15
LVLQDNSLIEEKKYERRFRKFGIATIAAVFFLIFVGGLVRSTGSGMGCPDWPKCFGQYVPPTDISQLPSDYKTQFAVNGKEIADFDTFKTWTEYVNRLIGVVIGILIFLTIVFSYPYLKTQNKKIFWLSFLAFILVGFEGWIGSKVVSTDLAVSLISIHMLLALAIVGLLIYTITSSQSFVIVQLQENKWIKPLLLFTIIISIVQTISGTQVREMVDEVAKRIDNRFLWIEELGNMFKFHRSWSILNLLVSIVLMLQYKSAFDRNSLIYRSGLALILLMAVQAFTGKILSLFGFPGYLQSVHLTLGSITAGLQMFIFILAFFKTKKI